MSGKLPSGVHRDCRYLAGPSERPGDNKGLWSRDPGFYPPPRRPDPGCLGGGTGNSVHGANMLGGEEAALHSGLQVQCAGDGLADSRSHRDINYSKGRSKLQ